MNFARPLMWGTVAFSGIAIQTGRIQESDADIAESKGLPLEPYSPSFLVMDLHLSWESVRSTGRASVFAIQSGVKPPHPKGLCFQITALILVIAALQASSQPPYSTENEMKAAALFNLGQFVEWPSNSFGGPDSSFVIGVLGQNPFGRSLDRVAKGETVQKRSVTIKYAEKLDGLGPCHILFISRSEAKRLPFLLRELKGKSILTASDMGGFALNGGMVNLVTADDRVRMRVNVTNIEAAGLRASSKLLRIAEIVKTE